MAPARQSASRRRHAPASYTPAVGDITLCAPWGNLAIFYKPFHRAHGLVRLVAFDGSIDVLIQEPGDLARISIAEKWDTGSSEGCRASNDEIFLASTRTFNAPSPNCRFETEAANVSKAR